MVQARVARACWEQVGRSLIEGRAVEINGTVVRFFPSLREVARHHRIHPSTVARWARRHGVSAARRERLAADRVHRPASTTPAIERHLEQTLALINTRWADRRKVPSVRSATTVLRLLGVLVGAIAGRSSLLVQLEHLRRQLLAGGDP